MLRILEYKCDYNSVVKTAEGGGGGRGKAWLPQRHLSWDLISFSAAAMKSDSIGFSNDDLRFEMGIEMRLVNYKQISIEC